MNIIAIIPARENSQRLKNKNMTNLNGKPLIYWTLQSAINSKYINDICVTSDSKKIIEYCNKFQVTSVLRPKSLSGNFLHPEKAITHAYLKLKKNFDYIVMLQPTSPLRLSIDIDKSIEIIIKDKSTSLFSSEINTSFIWNKNRNNLCPTNYKLKHRPRSQEFFSYKENGAIYITKSNFFLKNNNRLGGKISTYVMPSDRSIDIDNINDLIKTKYLMKSLKR